MLKLRCCLAPLNKVKRMKRRRPDDDDGNDDYDGLRRERMQPNMSKEISILTQQQQNSDSCRLLTDCHRTHTRAKKVANESRAAPKMSDIVVVAAASFFSCCADLKASQSHAHLHTLTGLRSLRERESESERSERLSMWFAYKCDSQAWPEHRHTNTLTTYDHLFVSPAERACSLSYSLSFSSAESHTNTTFCDLSSWHSKALPDGSNWAMYILWTTP